MDGVVDMDQGLGEGQTEAQSGKLDSEVFSEDAEVELVLHRSGTDDREGQGRMFGRCRKRRALKGRTGLTWGLCMGLDRKGIGLETVRGA